MDCSVHGADDAAAVMKTASSSALSADCGVPAGDFRVFCDRDGAYSWSQTDTTVFISVPLNIPAHGVEFETHPEQNLDLRVQVDERMLLVQVYEKAQLANSKPSVAGADLGHKQPRTLLELELDLYDSIEPQLTHWSLERSALACALSFMCRKNARTGNNGAVEHVWWASLLCDALGDDDLPLDQEFAAPSTPIMVSRHQSSGSLSGSAEVEVKVVDRLGGDAVGSAGRSILSDGNAINCCHKRNQSAQGRELESYLTRDHVTEALNRLEALEKALLERDSSRDTLPPVTSPSSTSDQATQAHADTVEELQERRAHFECIVGEAHFSGICMPRNYALAVKFLTKALVNGPPEQSSGRLKSSTSEIPKPTACAARAHEILGAIYMSGGDGVEKDFALGVQHCEAAAAHGRASALYSLGYFYLHHGLGDGGKQDLELAMKFFALANQLDSNLVAPPELQQQLLMCKDFAEQQERSRPARCAEGGSTRARGWLRSHRAGLVALGGISLLMLVIGTALGISRRASRPST
ncbi:hypothetical protein FVE85_3476 [Porphyridium purpureum]|uniref:CS domain-containing protein n=1 Tax=Porphyridium purpureum TaxID=35688 RepID=A0A5J4YL58_PORPP|nr:hypothetical protein FVE85_3476 [Porphyridium purpureum]|eukprot:POR2968..scf249_10